MTAGTEPAVLPFRHDRLVARSRRANLSRAQRFLFLLSLFAFGLATMYTCAVLLIRVTPALFPGKEFINVPVLGDLADKVNITAPPTTGSKFFDRINLLIIGVDRRPGYDDAPDAVRFGGNTDTLMIASLDPVGKTVSFLSFPRDMVINIKLPGNNFTYQDRINASYNAGMQAGGQTVDAGAHQLEADIRSNFGIEVNGYVLMDFSGVEKLVNSVGGVDVTVPDDLGVYNWYYSEDDYNARFVTIPPGPQHLDGYNAVAFGRNRDPSDFSRVKRQQLVLQGALSKIISGDLLNPATWPGLWDAYSTTIHTDMSKSLMFGLAPLLSTAVSRAKLFSVADPVNGTPSVWTGNLGDASVVYWNPDNVNYWLTQAFPKAIYSVTSVEVQNGFGADGTARAASLGRYLAYSQGLPTVGYGPDQPPQPLTTITLYSDASKVVAEDIARWLSIPKDRIRTLSKGEDTTLPDVVVVVGQDYKIPGS